MTPTLSVAAVHDSETSVGDGATAERTEAVGGVVSGVDAVTVTVTDRVTLPVLFVAVRI